MVDMRVSAGQGSAEDLQGPFVPLLESLEQSGLFQGWYCAGGGSLSVLSAMRLKERRRLQGLTGGGGGGNMAASIPSLLSPFPKTTDHRVVMLGTLETLDPCLWDSAAVAPEQSLSHLAGCSVDLVFVPWM